MEEEQGQLSDEKQTGWAPLVTHEPNKKKILTINRRQESYFRSLK